MKNRIALRIIVFELVLVTCLFGSAGRFDLPWFWVFLGAQICFLFFTLSVIDPELAKERFRPGAGGKDRSLRWVMMPFFLGQFVLAGLDAGRFHWSEPYSPIFNAIGLVMYCAGMLLAIWAMSVNRFFSPVVRIQEERGHELVTGGPYGVVRHPGYLGMFLCVPGISLLLSSWVSLIPLACVGALVLRRAVIEDRFLREELPGYAEYAARVRWRLVPGVW